MREATRESLIEGAILTTVVAIVLAAVYFMVIGWPSYECRARWEGSGYQTKFGLISRCRVSRDGVTWIPDDRMRVVEDSP